MTYDCSCDYDPPSVYSATTPRAKKQHKCTECSGPILPGERYERIFGIWEGYADTHKTCERCFDLRTWVKNNVPCLCIVHGNQDEENEIAITEARYRAPLETASGSVFCVERFCAASTISDQPYPRLNAAVRGA